MPLVAYLMVNVPVAMLLVVQPVRAAMAFTVLVLLMLMALVYCWVVPPPPTTGVELSVVYQITALELVSLIVTDCPAVYVPAAGLKVGVGTFSV